MTNGRLTGIKVVWFLIGIMVASALAELIRSLRTTPEQMFGVGSWHVLAVCLAVTIGLVVINRVHARRR